MLEATDLSCVRGERTLFAGFALRIEPGECVQVGGANGAGKTSLLRILCGLLAPAAGDVRWGGRSIRALREDYWGALAYVGHLNGIKDDLTAIENTRFAARLAGGDPAEAGAALARLGLAGREALPARVLSQGQKRRVALSRLLLAPRARLWILDEPFTALDTAGVQTVAAMIDAHCTGGGIAVLTSHTQDGLGERVRRVTLAGGEPESAP